MMRIYDIIKKKRDGGTLSTEEINYFVGSLGKEDVKDYQVSALLMAIYLNGISDRETTDLTAAMMNSGDVVDLSALEGVKVDKHSTGGVGDKTTLVLAPLVAACGVKLAKFSGRGLGHTGGTLDKLESIPGFTTELPAEIFMKNVSEIGLAVAGQTNNICPADKTLYALRDVTATVEQIGLIASSIMSKKLASGSNAIVLDIKAGSGAFMKTQESAKELAETMIKIGKSMGRDVCALISDMSQPLGYAIGNSLEVIEAIETLKMSGPDDLTELCVDLASQMVYMGLKHKSVDRLEAEKLVRNALETGAALDKFRELLQRQGGDVSVIDDYSAFKQAKYSAEVNCKKSGYITSFFSERIGLCSVDLGAGRRTKEEDIDYSAGIVLKKKIGDYCESGECIATIYSDDQSSFERVSNEINAAIVIEDAKVNAHDLILERIL